MVEGLFNVTSLRGEMDWWGAGRGVATLPRGEGVEGLCCVWEFTPLLGHPLEG